MGSECGGFDWRPIIYQVQFQVKLHQLQIQWIMDIAILGGQNTWMSGWPTNNFQCPFLRRLVFEILSLQELTNSHSPVLSCLHLLQFLHYHLHLLQFLHHLHHCLHHFPPPSPPPPPPSSPPPSPLFLLSPNFASSFSTFAPFPPPPPSPSPPPSPPPPSPPLHLRFHLRLLHLLAASVSSASIASSSPSPPPPSPPPSAPPPSPPPSPPPPSPPPSPPLLPPLLLLLLRLRCLQLLPCNPCSTKTEDVSNAQAHCSSMNGHLVNSISADQRQQVANNVSNSPVWINLAYDDSSNQWVGQWEKFSLLRPSITPAFLDHLLFKSITHKKVTVKIDVEGFECHVLLGMVSMMQTRANSTLSCILKLKEILSF